MKQALRLYRFINIISLDVALGAVTGAAFFSKIFETSLLPQGLAALGISVWIIYSVDHLLDAYKLKSRASSERHHFHQKHFREIIIAVIFLALLDVVLIFYVRPSVFNAGMLLAGVVIFYLLFHRWMYPLKEMAGAVLYSGGVLLPVLSLHDWPVNHPGAYLIIPFFITALINLLVFSWFGLEQDLRDGQLSLITFIGKRASTVVLVVLFGIQFGIIGLLMIVTDYALESAVILAMNLVLAFMLVFDDAFKKNDRYRLVGDIIFLFPLPYIILYG